MGLIAQLLIFEAHSYFLNDMAKSPTIGFSSMGLIAHGFSFKSDGLKPRTYILIYWANSPMPTIPSLRLIALSLYFEVCD